MSSSVISFPQKEVKSLNMLVVIVLYNQRLLESASYKSLLQQEQDMGKNGAKTIIYIYDNSPQEFIQDDIRLCELPNIHYVRNIFNPGISHAYNEGLALAGRTNKNWLLLLDQDSILPENYFITFFEKMRTVNSSVVVACVPKVKVLVKGKEKFIAPGTMVNYKVTFSPVDLTEGVYKNISTLNSGVFVSVSFMNAIGGFSEKYPLDCLDYWLFKCIEKQNKSVFVMNLYTQHDLSLYNPQGISLWRFESALKAQCQFLSDFGSRKDKILYNFRLLCVFLKNNGGISRHKREKCSLIMKYIFTKK
jgi:glycosyltransferase involved in cell wall biosynthesis